MACVSVPKTLADVPPAQCLPLVGTEDRARLDVWSLNKRPKLRSKKGLEKK